MTECQWCGVNDPQSRLIALELRVVSGSEDRLPLDTVLTSSLSNVEPASTIAEMLQNSSPCVNRRNGVVSRPLDRWLVPSDEGRLRDSVSRNICDSSPDLLVVGCRSQGISFP